MQCLRPKDDEATGTVRPPRHADQTPDSGLSQLPSNLVRRG
uniref:Uncharacterized protein n=1 Tax=Anguilla anguilla TaxID=7936 RepID=A0A0E9WML4_ANGAN